MPIQFLDSRISIHSNEFGGSDPLSDLPLLIGDIGLQVLAAIPLNTSNVRVALTGTAVIDFAPAVEPEEGILDPTVVTLTVERGGDGTAGTGVTILNEQFEIYRWSTLFPISVSAADFPPAADVLGHQIRYTLFIAVDGYFSLVLGGPAVFNGIASAGTT
ncbi:hypothetical protein [Paenibacillus sp. CF384]|uniref:hypothetical protein n=1 Tax=Paenibacillus sp. CF384 TaxID=1884382 RepID=UPI00089C74CA|nr:hypothetical protein [Paenibacillus sp. CF384]SDW80888.1 hypothetical protein SAMN05518855_1005192 [Paenibacillus sp. CF384]